MGQAGNLFYDRSLYGLLIRRSQVRILPGAFIYNGFSAVKKFYILWVFSRAGSFEQNKKFDS